MNMHSTLPFRSTEALVALAQEPAAHSPDALHVTGASEPRDPEALALSLHELRDLLAPVVQCAAILRMTSARDLPRS